jgi:hypothetical protein
MPISKTQKKNPKKEPLDSRCYNIAEINMHTTLLSSPCLKQATTSLLRL